MTPEEVNHNLTQLFGSNIQFSPPGLWQVETPELRLLVLLSDDGSWLRMLIPIVPAQQAQSFFEQLLELNFDNTQETRYALHQGVLWGVFHHSLQDLSVKDFLGAIARLLSLHEQGLSGCFNQLVETRISQIIQTAKSLGQSLESTLQTIERFYEEGVMGDMGQGEENREQVLEAWRQQLERLWQQTEP